MRALGAHGKWWRIYRHLRKPSIFGPRQKVLGHRHLQLLAEDRRMKDDDVTVKGRVLRLTPSGLGVVFVPNDRFTPTETVILPKSQIAVVKGVLEDEVTMPLWLAEQRGLA